MTSGRARESGSLEDAPPLNEVTVFDIKDRTFIRDECSKGDLVLVEGRLRPNSSERNGERAYTVDLIAHDFGLLAKANPLARSSAGEKARGH
jgi:single-stranded DNA-binding protein